MNTAKHLDSFYGQGMSGLYNGIAAALKELPNKSDPEAVTTAIHKVLGTQCEIHGMDPSVETHCWDQDTTEAKGYGRSYCVGWESGPYEWAIPVSMLVITLCRGILAEPHYSFNLCITYEG